MDELTEQPVSDGSVEPSAPIDNSGANLAATTPKRALHQGRCRRCLKTIARYLDLETIGKIVAIVVAVGLLYVNYVQLGITSKAAGAAVEATKETQEQVKDAKTQFKDTLRLMQDQTDAAKKAARFSKASADAAQSEAISATESLHFAQAESRCDQRPWLLLDALSLDKEVGTDPQFRGMLVPELNISATVQNFGKTPALNEVSYFRTMISILEPPISTYNTPNSYQTTPIESRSLLAPGKAHTTLGSIKFPLRNQRAILIDDYRLKSAKLYILGAIEYDDVFGQSHITSFCAYHYYGSSLNRLDQCAAGNSVDQCKK